MKTKTKPSPLTIIDGVVLAGNLWHPQGSCPHCTPPTVTHPEPDARMRALLEEAVCRAERGTTMSTDRLAEIKRYSLVTTNHVGGHYGEEQWQTHSIEAVAHGDFVSAADYDALLSRVASLEAERDARLTPAQVRERILSVKALPCDDLLSPLIGEKVTDIETILALFPDRITIEKE